jgi:hypothetical protein
MTMEGLRIGMTMRGVGIGMTICGVRKSGAGR